MFDIGFSELIVIALVALIVIGPERLPRVARTVGALVGRAQRYVNDVKNDIQREVNLDELKDIRSTFQDAAKEVEQSVSKFGAEMNAVGDTLNRSIDGSDETKADAEAAAPASSATPATGDASAAPAQMDLALEGKPPPEPAPSTAAAPKA